MEFIIFLMKKIIYKLKTFFYQRCYFSSRKNKRYSIYSRSNAIISLMPEEKKYKRNKVISAKKRK